MTCKYFSKFLLLIFVSLSFSSPIFAQSGKKTHHTTHHVTHHTTHAVHKASAPVFKFHTIIIDAGHGGKDPGAHGAYSKEKNVTLAIAKRLRTALREQMPSLKVVMTRSTDEFVELHRRDDIAAENKGDLFISIHCNSSPRRVTSERGVLLLVYGYHRQEEQLEAIRENASIFIEKNYQKRYNGYGENSAVNAIVLRAFQQKYRRQCILFADLLNHQFTKVNDRHSYGVKEQGVLVLQQSAMPAVLIETGFINNPKDEVYLNSVRGQAQIVYSIIRAIRIYRERLEQQK